MLCWVFQCFDKIPFVSTVWEWQHKFQKAFISWEKVAAKVTLLRATRPHYCWNSWNRRSVFRATVKKRNEFFFTKECIHFLNSSKDSHKHNTRIDYSEICVKVVKYYMCTYMQDNNPMTSQRPVLSGWRIANIKWPYAHQRGCCSAGIN